MSYSLSLSNQLVGPFDCDKDAHDSSWTAENPCQVETHLIFGSINLSF